MKMLINYNIVTETEYKRIPIYQFSKHAHAPSVTQPVHMTPVVVLGHSLLFAMFVWLISHQPAVFFSQNKPAISQPYFSLRTNQHQPPAKRTGWLWQDSVPTTI
jgi:hypothetical protein